MLQLKHSHMYYYQCQLQIFVTKRSFCDLVFWSKKELHIECITLNKSLIDSSLPIAERVFKHCIFPELYGKWYTRAGKPSGKDHSLPPPRWQGMTSWCYCKAGKGGDMVACDNESCSMTQARSSMVFIGQAGKKKVRRAKRAGKFFVEPRPFLS